MPRRRKFKPVALSPTPTLKPNAAGVDIGATEIYIAVPPDRDAQPVRRFATFTADLMAAADWLQRCGVETVAMESTGVYWIPLFQMLEARGFQVCLVNARHVKNVPGRKSDVSDCQWLQYLHTVGLLHACFRPEQQVCAVRSLMRYRESLVEMAAVHLQHMQKALDQMNLQLHHVISDLSGTTGMAILDAILAGERDPHRLARLRDPRIQATPATIVKSLVGDYRREHLFTLRQSVAAYRHYQQLMAACDVEIEQMLGGVFRWSWARCAGPTRAQRPAQAATQPVAVRPEGTSLPHFRGGPDRSSRRQCAHRPYLPDRGGTGSVGVSQRGGLCLVDGAVSGQPGQRRQTAQFAHAPGQEPDGQGAAASGAGAAPKPVLAGPVLPAYARQTRRAQGHHGRRAQAGTHPLSPAHHPASL